MIHDKFMMHPFSLKETDFFQDQTVSQNKYSNYSYQQLPHVFQVLLEYKVPEVILQGELNMYL